MAENVANIRNWAFLSPSPQSRHHACAGPAAGLGRQGDSACPRAAYGDGLTGLVRVGPLGEMRVRDVVTRGESAVLALRWQAAGPGGRLFPALMPTCR